MDAHRFKGAEELANKLVKRMSKHPIESETASEMEIISLLKDIKC